MSSTNSTRDEGMKTERVVPSMKDILAALKKTKVSETSGHDLLTRNRNSAGDRPEDHEAQTPSELASASRKQHRVRKWFRDKWKTVSGTLHLRSSQRQERGAQSPVSNYLGRRRKGPSSDQPVEVVIAPRFVANERSRAGTASTGTAAAADQAARTSVAAEIATSSYWSTPSTLRFRYLEFTKQDKPELPSSETIPRTPLNDARQHQVLSADDPMERESSSLLARDTADIEILGRPIFTYGYSHLKGPPNDWNDIGRQLLHRQAPLDKGLSRPNESVFNTRPMATPQQVLKAPSGVKTSYSLPAQNTQKRATPYFLGYEDAATLLEATFAGPCVASPKNVGRWTDDEHQRYLEGLEKYPYGSWKPIADHVKTRTVRQVISHSQSIRMKRKQAKEDENRSQTLNRKLSSDTPSKRSKVARTTSAKSSAATKVCRLPSTTNRQKTLAEQLMASMKSLPPEYCSPDHLSNSESNQDCHLTTSAADNAVPQPLVTRTMESKITGLQFAELGGENLHKKLSLDFHNSDKSPMYADPSATPDGESISPLLNVLLGSYENDEELFACLDIPSAV